MNYNFDKTFISQELENSEQGLANIFKKYYTGRIIVTSVKHKTGYIWNSKTKIYEDLAVEMIINNISDLLRCAVELKIKQINDIPNDILSEKEKEKKNKPYFTIKANIGKSKTIYSIYSFLLQSYFNKDIALKMNNNDNIIPVKGGKLIDLTTGIVRDRVHTDYFTYEKDVEYLGKNSELTKNAETFFKQLACDDTQKFEYLKLVMGSAITSYTQMKCFFILYGNKGNNGKSTLMQIMENIFNDLYVALPTDLIFAENADKVDDTQFGTLLGKTLGTSIEPKNRHTNDSVLKLLTGSDTISCRRRFEDAISYNPKVKIFIMLNNVLRIGQDEIIKKRTRVINFDAEFVDKPKMPNQYKADPNISSKFTTIWKNEFFSFIVNCAIAFLKSDNKQLIPPKVVEDEKNDYFDNMDYIGRTLQETFEFTKNPKDKVLRSEINSVYELLCSEQEKKYNSNKLLEYLVMKFGEARRTSGFDRDGNVVKGAYFHTGIKYRNSEEREEVDDVDELKAIIQKQAKEIEELKKLLQQKPEIKENTAISKFNSVEETEEELDALLSSFHKPVTPVKAERKIVKKSKVVVESDSE